MIHADLPDGQDLQQGWKLSTANNLVYDTLWSGFLTNVNVTIVSSKFWEPISQPILRQQRREIRQWNGICQTSPNIHFLIIDFYEILRNGGEKNPEFREKSELIFSRIYSEMNFEVISGIVRLSWNLE